MKGVETLLEGKLYSFIMRAAQNERNHKREHKKMVKDHINVTLLINQMEELI